jgi:hypothetical protein
VSEVHDRKEWRGFGRIRRERKRTRETSGKQDGAPGYFISAAGGLHELGIA